MRLRIEFSLSIFMEPCILVFVINLGGTDTVYVLDADGDTVAMAGPLPGSATIGETYQRDEGTGEFILGAPTPGWKNDPTGSLFVQIYEVAPRGSTGGPCADGEDWVELFNEGFQAVDITNYVISHSDNEAETYEIPETEIASRSFLVVCGGDLGFDIGDTDSLKLTSASGEFASESVKIGEGADGSINLDVGVTWSMWRPSPSEVVFSFTEDATPGAQNLFTYVGSDRPVQECGIASTGYPGTDELNLQEKFTFGETPEFSGGSYYGGTCTHYVNGDEGTVHELQIEDGEVTRLRKFTILGATADTEGSCFYVDQETGITKIAILDEGSRSVALCDVPAEEIQDAKIYRDSSNCRVLGMTEEMMADPLTTSENPNKGFEGVACDPWNKKLYVAQEEEPRRIFSVDVETGAFQVIIDIENNPAWSGLVSDLSGVSI